MAEGKRVGEWAFIVGIFIAIIIGLFSGNLRGVSPNIEGGLVLLLVIAGLVVGFLNVTDKESTAFLVATAALLITGTAENQLKLISFMGIGDAFAGVVKQIGVFVAPAAIIVALKSLHSLAKD